MSMSPPPGWYPDPSTPGVERWWDGSAWSEHRRTPADLPPTAPGLPGLDPALVQPPSTGGGARARVIALSTAAAVLIAAIVTGVLVLQDDDGDPTAGPPPSTSQPPSPDPTTSAPEPTTSASDPDPDTLVDQLNGITLPVPDGWEKADNVVGDELTLHTPDTYDCPGDTGFCRHGSISTRTVTGTDERSPRKLARADIADAADAAYDHDTLDRKPFGGITSHRQVKSGTVAVAGRGGYFVRWRVHTAKGPGGYVQSLAFPSSTGSEAMVIVRFHLDASDEAPPLSDFDEVIDGIRPVGDSEMGGGVGSSVGPTP
ncbi:DUF2510 domain-containing protein [Streptomyces sp. G45]|uniref:DUF2510 domain-containing protein n=1 Tax=Streptomyces sp. G45 TaxID=3406627 RepID=UPI003C14D84D